MIEIELPWPPSANHYYRKFNNRMVISKSGREYRDKVNRIIVESGVKTITGAIAVKRILYCPDWRRRDEDNLAKVIYDSLTKALVWEDDSYVCLSVSEKRKDEDGIGRVVIQIKNVDDAIIKKTGAWLK